MPQFTTDNQPKAKRGRPKGSKNAKTLLPKKVFDMAVDQLEAKVLGGDLQAILWILNRKYPALKPITSTDSLDGEMLQARIFEVTELEERLLELERLADERNK